MSSDLFNTAGNVLAAFLRGAAPDADQVRLLREQAAGGTPAMASAVGPPASAAQEFDPDALANADDQQLEAIFRASGTLGIDRLLNSGVRTVDSVRREIHNDAYWKGYLPKGLPLGEMASQLYTGYYKRFWREGDRYLGETRGLDGRVPLRHTLEEVTLDRGVNDLEPGRYILLRYADAVFAPVFYDVMRVVTGDVVLYRGYVGQFPEGRRGWCAPLLRRYGFAQMDAEDHSSLFGGAAPAAVEDLPGRWRLDIVANSNHATGIAEVTIERNADGTLRSRAQANPSFESAALQAFAIGHFRVRDFRGLLGEIRRIDRDVLLGRWIIGSRNKDAGSLGVFQTAKDARGQKRLAIYYILNRMV